MNMNDSTDSRVSVIFSGQSFAWLAISLLYRTPSTSDQYSWKEGRLYDDAIK